MHTPSCPLLFPPLRSGNCSIKISVGPLKSTNVPMKEPNSDISIQSVSKTQYNRVVPHIETHIQKPSCRRRKRWMENERAVHVSFCYYRFQVTELAWAGSARLVKEILNWKYFVFLFRQNGIILIHTRLVLITKVTLFFHPKVTLRSACDVMGEVVWKGHSIQNVWRLWLKRKPRPISTPLSSVHSINLLHAYL